MIKRAQGEEIDSKALKGNQRRGVKERWKSFNGRWGGIKGQWEGTKGQWKGIKGQWGGILKGNEEALMGDKRCCRVTKGVLRWQRSIKWLWRCDKGRQEYVFVAFRSTPLLCNWRLFCRPLTPLLCPECPFSLTHLCCNWRPFRHSLMPLLGSERLSIVLQLFVVF